MILHSQIIGEGTPLVILHGFLGMGDNWKTLGNKFSSLGYQVHLVDQRNHGRSFHSDEFSYKIMANDLKQYLESHEIEKAIFLGHSMGGKTAMQVAVDNPERVLKLLIADIGPKEYPSHHQDILKALSLLDFTKINSRKEAETILTQYIKEVGVRQFLLKNLYWKNKGQLALRVNLPVLINKYNEVGVALSQEASYSGETLFLKGANSGYIEEIDEILIKKHFPNSKIETISNAGHWLHAENPQEFYQFVSNFL